MLRLMILFVCVFFGVAAHAMEKSEREGESASWCLMYQPEWTTCRIGQRVEYQEHHLSVVVLENGLMEQHLLLLRGEQVVFDRYGHSMFWGEQVASQLRAGVDLSGDGTPYLVIANHQQGSGGYIDYSLVRIDERVEEVTAFETTRGALFTPSARGWVITYQDDHWRFKLGLYSYKWGWPSLVRAFDGEQFSVSSEHMRKPVPAIEHIVWEGYESIELQRLMVKLIVTGHAMLAKQWFFWHVEEDAKTKWEKLVAVARSHPDLDKIDAAQDLDSKNMFRMKCLANRMFGEALQMDRLGLWSDALRKYEKFEQLLKVGRWCSQPGSIAYGDHYDRLGAVALEFAKVRQLLIKMRLGLVDKKSMGASVHISKMSNEWPVGFGGRPVIQFLAGAKSKQQFVSRCEEIGLTAEKWNDINQLVPRFVVGSDVQPTIEDVCRPLSW